MNAMEQLMQVVLERKAVYERGEADVENQSSYTCYLFSQGEDKILKKVGEECAETIIAAKNHDPVELQNEMADLLYHLAVLCAQENLPWRDVEEELLRRSQKIGNRKPQKHVDHNS